MRKTVVALGLAFVFIWRLSGPASAHKRNSVDFVLPNNPQTQALITATGMTQAQLQTFLTGKLDQLFRDECGEFPLGTWGCPEFQQQGLGVDYASGGDLLRVGGWPFFRRWWHDRTYQPGSTLVPDQACRMPR